MQSLLVLERKTSLNFQVEVITPAERILNFQTLEIQNPNWVLPSRNWFPIRKNGQRAPKVLILFKIFPELLRYFIRRGELLQSIIQTFKRIPFPCGPSKPLLWLLKPQLTQDLPSPRKIPMISASLPTHTLKPKKFPHKKKNSPPNKVSSLLRNPD